MNNITKFSKISNVLFLILSIFCLSFIWCNYYVKNLRISLYSSIIIVICLSIIIFIYYNTKNKKSNYKTKTNLRLEQLKNFLLYNNQIDTISLLSHIINLEKFEKINTEHYYSQLENCDIYFLFYDDNILTNKLFKIYKSRITINLKIYCIKKPNFKNLIENINMQFIDINEIMSIINEKNILLNNNIKIINKPKFSLKGILCIVLNKSKSKSYFTLGVLLLFSILFTIYNIYYIISSSILILLSIYCRYNTKFN